MQRGRVREGEKAEISPPTTSNRVGKKTKKPQVAGRKSGDNSL